MTARSCSGTETVDWLLYVEGWQLHSHLGTYLLESTCAFAHTYVRACMRSTYRILLIQIQYSIWKFFSSRTAYSWSNPTFKTFSCGHAQQVRERLLLTKLQPERMIRLHWCREYRLPTNYTRGGLELGEESCHICMPVYRLSTDPDTTATSKRLVTHARPTMLCIHLVYF